MKEQICRRSQSKIFWSVVVVAVGVMVQPFAQALTFSLTNDWSDATNPFGNWTMRYIVTTPTTLTFHDLDWFGSGDPVWSTGNDQIPGIGKSTTVNPFRWNLPSLGTIFGHTPAGNGS